MHMFGSFFFCAAATRHERCTRACLSHNNVLAYFFDSGTHNLYVWLNILYHIHHKLEQTATWWWTFGYNEFASLTRINGAAIKVSGVGSDDEAVAFFTFLYLVPRLVPIDGMPLDLCALTLTSSRIIVIITISYIRPSCRVLALLMIFIVKSKIQCRPCMSAYVVVHPNVPVNVFYVVLQ